MDIAHGERDDLFKKMDKEINYLENDENHILISYLIYQNQFQVN